MEYGSRGMQRGPPCEYMLVLHHISTGVSNLESAVSFYDKALVPSGCVRVWSHLRSGEQGQAVGYGEEGGGDWLALEQVPGSPICAMPGIHVAFTATSRQAVTAFHLAALAAGATDDGKPGVREQYGPNYFAAFVIDPDGHHLEAACKIAM